MNTVEEKVRKCKCGAVIDHPLSPICDKCAGLDENGEYWSTNFKGERYRLSPSHNWDRFGYIFPNDEYSQEFNVTKDPSTEITKAVGYKYQNSCDNCEYEYKDDRRRSVCQLLTEMNNKVYGPNCLDEGKVYVSQAGICNRYEENPDKDD